MRARKCVKLCKLHIAGDNFYTPDSFGGCFSPRLTILGQIVIKCKQKAKNGDKMIVGGVGGLVNAI